MLIQHIREYVKFVSNVYPVKNPVVEIGSYLVQGQLELADMRPFFKGMDFTGCDMRPGPGVDRIEDLQQLRFEDESVGTMLVLETLEHVKNPFIAFEEMYRVLTPGGLLILSIPFYFPIHEFPSDYWRYTPYCLNMLLDGFYRLISWENMELPPTEAQVKPRTVFAIASKQEFSTVVSEKIRQYGKSAGHFFLSEDGRTTDDIGHSYATSKVYRAHWRRFS